LEQAAQGSGVTIPGGVHKTCGYDTSRHGGVGVTVGLDNLKRSFPTYDFMQCIVILHVLVQLC